MTKHMNNEAGKLAGKVAVVTGASKGIGAEIARAFGREGASVVVHYNSSKADADAVAAEVRELGGNAVIVGADVSGEDAGTTIVNAAVENFGRLDVLVNNAGISEFRAFEEFTADHYERQFRTNVLGTMLITAAAVKHFETGASIINIGSSATEFTPPAASVYIATKGAIDAFTRALASELGPRGIRVNCIKPGMTVTEKQFDDDSTVSDFVKTFVEQTPLRRLGKTTDIANAAIFLASDASAFITGERILVSGGLR